MRRIKWPFRANRQPNTVNGERVFRAKRFKLCKGAPAVTHVVFGVYFKPINRAVDAIISEKCCGLYPTPTPCGSLAKSGVLEWSNMNKLSAIFRMYTRKVVPRACTSVSDYAGRSRSSGSSDPMRSPSTSRVSHVPAATSVHALPW